MPDNWSFVFAAYGLAGLVLGGYWRFLRRRERELDRLASGAGAARRRRPAREPGGNDASRPQPAPPTPAR